MNEPFSWLAVFSKLGVQGTASLAVVLAIAGAVGTNVGNVREHVLALFDYQHNETHEHNETHYYNSDGNITNAPSVVQTHEHPEIDERFNKVEGRLANLEQGQVGIYGRLTNLEQGQADIYGRLDEVDERLTNLEQGQVEIKATLQEFKSTLQKLLEKP